MVLNIWEIKASGGYFTKEELLKHTEESHLIYDVWQKVYRGFFRYLITGNIIKRKFSVDFSFITSEYNLLYLWFFIIHLLYIRTMVYHGHEEQQQRMGRACRHFACSDMRCGGYCKCLCSSPFNIYVNARISDSPYESYHEASSHADDICEKTFVCGRKGSETFSTLHFI